MKNIHILPTDNPSRLFYNVGGALLFTKWDNYNGVNIYITSDEYIGLSYYLDGNLVRKGMVDDKDYWEVRKDYKKIILTTDQDLIKDGVQAIDDEFLDWFVNNPSCEEVEVLFACRGLDGNTPIGEYRIIIPKESLTKITDNGDGTETLSPSDPNFGKIIIPKEEPKQETLEEVAERVTEEWFNNNSYAKELFIEGVKWQQEQILDFLYEEITERRDYSASKMCEKVIEFIEKFKKK